MSDTAVREARSQLRLSIPSTVSDLARLNLTYDFEHALCTSLVLSDFPPKHPARLAIDYTCRTYRKALRYLGTPEEVIDALETACIEDHHARTRGEITHEQ